MKNENYKPYDHNMEYKGIMLYADTEYRPKEPYKPEGWLVNDVYVTRPLNSEIVYNNDGTDNLYSIYHILLKPNEILPEKAQLIRDITRMTINRFSNEDQILLAQLINKMSEFHSLLEKDIKEYAEQIKADYYIDQQMWKKHD